MRVLPLVLLSCLLAVDAGDPPYAPADALATFRLEPGFRIELMTSEPDVTSPVAMDIDERGRWFVVEMPGYPIDTRPLGRVRLLEDVNGDGKPDRSSVFADGLVLPTGVLRWKRGVLVTAAPDLIYFEDADDDGRAEKREVVLTGFAVTNPQHSVNHPVYGLDNGIHLVSGGGGALIFPELFGDRGKPLTFPGAPAVPGVDPRGRPVRVQFDPPRVDVRSGRTQFGGTFDAYGRYFTSSNNDHIRHEVVAARYLERNPQLPVTAAMHVISDHGGAARVFPVTVNPRYELLTESGEFTSACALTAYTGGLFGGEYARSTFVAEPVHNVVHRDVLEPSGATFLARRGGEGREFLASTDPWFRPVNFYIGPDGALYVIDYYRPRIEHPEWTASEFHAKPAEFWEGRERGRIYRVVPETAGPPARVDLSAADAATLVEALSHENQWHRRTAQRLLVERRLPGAPTRLAALAREGMAPLGRLHALWTLDGLGLLDAGQVLRALGDADAGVRENALQLAEPRLAGSEALRAGVLARAVTEGVARVRFQVLATLGGLEGPESHAAQQRLFFSQLDDPWMQVAALAAGPDRPKVYLSAALEPASPARARDSEAARAFFTLAASAVAGARDAAEVAALVEAVGETRPADAWWQAAVLEGLRRGLRGSSAGVLASSRGRLAAMAAGSSPGVRRAALALLQIAGAGDEAAVAAAVAGAAATASDASVDPDRRADAIALSALGGVGGREAVYEALVVPEQPEAVQVAALQALASAPGEPVGRFALAAWPRLTPKGRHAAVELLLKDPARQRMLVAALQQGAVQSWAMDFWQKRALIMHRDPELRAAARALLEDRPESRAAVVNAYAAAVERGGDGTRGEAVFARACAACHKVGGGAATDLGPDLSGIRHRPPLALLVDVLSPNQAIAQGYETYVVERTNGRSEAGTLADQSPTSVTLRQAGQPVVIPRREIRQLTMLPQSSMPAHLDKVISPQEMADLLAYLTRR